MTVIASHRTGTAAGSGTGLPRFGFVRRIGQAATLLPVSVAAVGAIAVGRPDAARRWWARIAEQGPAGTTERRPGAARLLAHGLLAVPLGLLTLIPIGAEVLFVLRGVLYPLVQPGPYTNAWGGPSTAGAWLAHFGVGLPTAAAGLGVLWLLHRLHARLAGGMWGRRVGAWPVVATAAALGAGALLVNAWLHQL
ncbi:hypothetical protein RMN57_20625 [Kitasatospora sp. CM 4170]|uniref:Integral membrane protein n=1 Tax=Kitasatospora aburaviensis TaxID=67265 RepID=A0ABW1F6G1_9ACTN|nr:hypothetical protein [Kitasatospora sp. CM 4170]WNM46932.1 hypothetical protein RMN57_20625 [Kitasatospora sp. CM 4170]